MKFHLSKKKAIAHQGAHKAEQTFNWTVKGGLITS